MSSSRRGERSLSYRLRTLHSYYQNQENVWDIGCDHGQLGLSFTDIESVKSIHLVDPSKPVIDVLHNTIKDAYISIANINIHHSEGQKLTITEKSNCIFIAGMGGKEIGLILENLVPQLDESTQVIISPHRKILELRKLLNEMPIGLLKEEVIFEDRQFYQIMSLGKASSRKVSPYGEDLWETDTGKQYREHQLKAFEVHSDEASKQYVSFLKLKA